MCPPDSPATARRHHSVVESPRILDVEVIFTPLIAPFRVGLGRVDVLIPPFPGVEVGHESREGVRRTLLGVLVVVAAVPPPKVSSLPPSQMRNLRSTRVIPSNEAQTANHHRINF